MPGTLVGISSRTVSQRVEIIGTTPEIRLTETDQTDPAGRYRLGVSADSFFIERSGAAGWANGLGEATNFVFLQYDRTNTSLLLNPYESNAWNVRLLAGAAATPGTNANLVVQAHATTPSIDLQTGNGAGAALVSRLLVGGGTGTPDIDIASARMDFNSNAVVGFAVIRGNGTADIQILGNKVATDATARNIGFYLLDPATDTETLLVQLTANGLTPSLDLQDNLLLRIGTSGDTGITNISAGLAANTASAGTLEGTPVTPVAIAANSMVIGNITNDGDILIAVSKAGTSHMAFMADASTGDTLLGASTGQSVDVYIAGVKEIDYATGALAFQQATTISTTTGALTISPSGNLILKNGLNFIGDTANANMTVGLTINMGANTNQILAFKQSGVAHGITSVAVLATETDDFAVFGQTAAAAGGLYIGALGENAANVVNFLLESLGGQAQTTKTTAGRSLVEITVGQHDGANALAAVAADGNVFGVRARVGAAYVARFMVDEDGDIFTVTVVDVAAAGPTNVAVATAFDEYDDVALVRAFERSRLPVGLIETEWDKFVEYNEADLVRLGILGAPVSEGGMWNLTQHVRLLNGAVWQLYTQLHTALGRLAVAEERLQLKGA